MRKIISVLVILLSSLVLFSCSKEEVIVDEVKLLDVYVSQNKTKNIKRSKNYVEANSDFYLHLCFDNPNENEILSLVVNDIKYQSYNFETNSTPEEIIIKLSSGEPGTYNYVINKIKYVYDTKILDVLIENNNYVTTVNVKRDECPEIYLDVISDSKGTRINFRIIDDGKYNSYYRFIVLDGDEVVYVEDKNYLDNNLFINTLEEGKLYKLIVMCYTDLLDGNGVVGIKIYEDMFRSYADLSFSKLIIYDTYVLYDLKLNIVPTSYKIILNDMIDVTASKKIDNLKPDTKYKLSIIYKKKTVLKEYKIDYIFQTKEQDKVEISDINIVSNKDKIEYKIEFNNSNLLDFVEVILLDEELNIVASNNSSNGVFANLKSNNIYKLRINYKYGDKEEFSEKFVMTKMLENPIFKPILISFTDYIYIDYETIDNDDVIKKVNIFFVTKDGYENIFSDEFKCLNTVFNRKYTIIYKLYLDYNDGTGLKEEVYQYEVIGGNKCKFEYDILVNDDNVHLIINEINYINNYTFIAKSALLLNLNNIVSV